MVDGRRIAQEQAGIGAHGFALAVILFALLPLVGTDAPWSADVGAQLYEATAIADGAGWLRTHPYPEIDPDGTWFPLHLAFRSADGHGYVVFGKHVAHTWAVGGLNYLGGFTAVLALSVLGTLGAAVGTARLTALFAPRAALGALWFAGLASPLLFDAYIGYGHSISAAGVAWAAVFLCRWVERSARAAGLAAGLALLIGVGLIRTEAPLAGLGLAVGLVAAAIAGRDHDRRRWVLAGAAAATASTAGVMLDRSLAVPIGDYVVADPRQDRWGFWDGRAAALVNTWFAPGSARADILILVGAVLILGAGFIARQRSPKRGATPAIIGGCLAAACLCFAARATVAPWPLVPGLVMAFPALFAGLAMFSSRQALRTPAAAACAVGFAAYCGAVLATEYPYGGVSEWGGRYFAAGLPLGIAPAAAGFTTWRWEIPARPRRALGAVAASAAIGLQALGLAGLASSRTLSDSLSNTVAAAVRAQPIGNGSTPVVVATAPMAPRLAWSQLDNARWLLVTNGELAEVGALLVADGVDAFTIVSMADGDELDQLDESYTVTSVADQVGSLRVTNVASDAG